MEPTTVWLVRPGSPEAVEGVLTLERHTLTFTPDDQEPLPIPLARISRVRRRRASPVLEVRYTDARAELSTLFLYFVKPPPLPTPRTGPGWILPTRGLERTACAMSLRSAARAVRRKVDAWARAIRERGAG